MKPRTGHIRKRGKKHQAIVTWHEASGERKSQSESHSTREEAQAFINVKLAELDQGRLTYSGRKTLASYLQEWLPGLALEVRPTTHSWYRSAVERHIIPSIGGQRLDGVTPQTLKSFYAAKLDHGRLDGQGGLSPTSVRRLHVTLSRAFQDAVRSGLLARNPAGLVTPPRVEQRDASADVWTPEQLSAFLTLVTTDRLSALWRLLALTGLRRSEALGLEWSAIDFEGGRLSVRQTLVLVDGRPEFSEPKTDRARRAVALDAETVSALRLHRLRQNEERLAFGGDYEDLGLVFCHEDGTPLRPDWVTRRFGRLTDQLPPIPLHGLRHSHATALLSAGVHPRIVQERLGHSSARVTLDIYSSVLPGMQAEAAEAVASNVDRMLTGAI